MLKKMVVVVSAVCALAAAAGAQKSVSKSWSQWSKKDAEKVLNDSPWGQTQTETDTSEMFFTPTTQASSQSRNAEGATNQAVSVKYFVRFFTARPIRQGLARTMMLSGKVGEDQKERLKAFTDLESNQYIIVTVTFASTDQRFTGQANQAFASAETSTLKNNTYLERKKDGKRVFLAEYVKPGPDGFGARFIFPRTLDGQPFLTPDSGEVRFVAEFPGNLVAASRQINQAFLKIDRRFKVASMMYGDKLEY